MPLTLLNLTLLSFSKLGVTVAVEERSKIDLQGEEDLLAIGIPLEKFSMKGTYWLLEGLYLLWSLNSLLNIK